MADVILHIVDEKVELVVDGAELLAPIVARASSFADDAAASAAAAKAAIPVEVPFGPLVNGERVRSMVVEKSGRVASVRTIEGNLFIGTPNGYARVGVRMAPFGPLVNGERVSSMRVNALGQILSGETLEGSRLEGDLTGFRLIAAKGGSAGGATPVYFLGSDVTKRRVYNYPAGGKHYTLIGTAPSQSNGAGHGALPFYDASTTLYPNNVFMLTGGIHRVATTRSRELAPAKEAQFESYYATCLTSCASHLYKLITDNVPGVDPKFVVFNTAIGGKPLKNLGRGGEAAADRAAQYALEDVKAAVLAVEPNATFDIIWLATQGESDQGGGFTTQERVRHWEAEIRRLKINARRVFGEIEDPVMIVNQISSVRSVPDKWTQSIRMADVLLDQAGKTVLAGGFYHLTMGDTIHLDGPGQADLGVMDANAIFNGVYGNGWCAVVPSQFDRHGWSADGKVLDIPFECEAAPLVLDTSSAVVKTAGLVNGTGIEFDDGTGTAYAFTLSIVAGRTLRFTFTTAPTGPNPRIGIAITNAGDQDGPVSGARSILRDSAVHTNSYTATTKNNWAVGGVLPVPKGN